MASKWNIETISIIIEDRWFLNFNYETEQDMIIHWNILKTLIVSESKFLNIYLSLISFSDLDTILLQDCYLGFLNS